MPRLIAFLRAINVGGHTVTMGELRGLFERLGFKGVETFIASGNVIFDAPSKDTSALERRIEDHLQESLGYEVKTFIRTDVEVAAIARHQPFTASERESAGALCVGFLAEPLKAEGRKSLMALKTEIDDFHVHGREVYWVCRKKQSESTFSNVRFEKIVKCRTTFRGVKTVARLATKYPGRG
jgi:uncharacterized protein (DUF1697 family)